MDVTKEQLALINHLKSQNITTTEQFDEFGKALAESVQRQTLEGVEQDNEEEDDDEEIDPLDLDEYDDDDDETPEEDPTPTKESPEVTQKMDKLLRSVTILAKQNKALIERDKKRDEQIKELMQSNQKMSRERNLETYSDDVIKFLQEDDKNEYPLIKNSLSNPDRKFSKQLLAQLYLNTENAKKNNEKLTMRDNLKFFEEDLKMIVANTQNKEYVAPKESAKQEKDTQKGEQNQETTQNKGTESNFSLDGRLETSGKILPINQKTDETDPHKLLEEHDKNAQVNFEKHFTS